MRKLSVNCADGVEFEPIFESDELIDSTADGGRGNGAADEFMVVDDSCKASL